MDAMLASAGYGATVRVLLCSNCGAAFDAALEGGSIQCHFCSAVSELAARPYLPAFAPLTAPPIGEAERLLRLRQQTGRPMFPPSSLSHLLDPGGGIPAWRNDEAFAAWQSARKRTAMQASDAAEELFFLSEVLESRFAAEKDWTRHRAMLESALEADVLPRHRSVYAANLALGACRQNDPVGAESWMAVVDPASDDLYADSMYRVATARVAAVRGNFAGVLTVLGDHADAVPIHSAIDCLVNSHRANALERVGREDDAIAELLAAMKSASDRATVELVVARYELCPRTFATALAQAKERAAVTAVGRMPGGGVFVWLGGLMLVVGVGGATAALVGAGIWLKSPSPRHHHAHVDRPLAGDLMGYGLFIGAVFLFLGLLFYAIGKSDQSAAKKARRLVLTGKRAMGTILSVERTGMETNGLVEVLIRLRVDLEGAAPYEASMKFLGAAPEPGTRISLRVDPAHPEDIVGDA